MVNIEVIVIFLIKYRKPVFYNNHMKSQTHINNFLERQLLNKTKKSPKL